MLKAVPHTVTTQILQSKHVIETIDLGSASDGETGWGPKQIEAVSRDLPAIAWVSLEPRPSDHVQGSLRREGWGV